MRRETEKSLSRKYYDVTSLETTAEQLLIFEKIIRTFLICRKLLINYIFVDTEQLFLHDAKLLILNKNNVTYYCNK